MSVIFCTGFQVFPSSIRKSLTVKKVFTTTRKTLAMANPQPILEKYCTLLNTFLYKCSFNFFHPNTGKPYVKILRYEKKSLPQTIFRTPFTIYWIRNGIYLFRMVILRIKSFCVVNMTHLFLNFSYPKA